MFLPNSQNFQNITPYNYCLQNYNYSAKEMKGERDKIVDRETIEQVTDYFRAINEVTENLHEG